MRTHQACQYNRIWSHGSFPGILSNKGISKEVEGLLSTFWRKGTHKNYDSAWRKWEQWCISTHVSPISASLNDILAFLAAQFHAGHAYHSLNIYRSAPGVRNDPFSRTRFRNHQISNTDFPISATIYRFPDFS